jgi:predicted signal transduction protein with EAL and GGDEF domain
MLITGAIESYYIFSRHPLDMSMIGFGIFGLLVYFFSLHYRAMEVLDRMLGSMASDMPDALFFFDNSGKCIWTNDPGKKLLGIPGENYDDVKDNLRFLFDDIDLENSGWSKRISIGEGEEAQFMYLAMRSAVDDKGKITGTYLSIRDVTEEQNEMKREMYNATHDSLTGLYTAEYLYEMIDQRLNNDRKTDYMVAFFEVSNFKLINDVFGREFGKLVLKNIAARYFARFIDNFNIGNNFCFLK